MIACAPTGSGKTLMSLEVTRRALLRRERVLYLVPRRELIDQLCWKIDKWDPGSYGVIAAGTKHRKSSYASVQVGSVDTLVSRIVRKGSAVVPLADLIQVDEWHLFQTEQRQALLNLFPEARIIGWTATPCRFDGQAIGQEGDELIEIETPKGLIKKGILVQPEYHTPSKPDLKRMRTIMGDYVKKQADERMEPLLGGIVEHWMELNSEHVTVVYANSVGQSAYLAQEFRKHGISAEHCDGGYDDTTRDEIFTRFRKTETQVLCNVDLATYGFDLPELSCVVIARPTKSPSRYLQMGGRGMRAHPGKTKLRVQDHSGCVREHGYLEDDRYWTLEGRKKSTKVLSLAASPAPPKLNGDRMTTELRLECPQCHLVFGGSLRCLDCGFYFERQAKSFQVIEGQLVRIGGTEPVIDDTDKKQFYRELLGYAVQKEYRFGWAAFSYESKYKAMPPKDWAAMGPLPPSPKTLGYIKHLQIRRGRFNAKKKASA